MKKVITKNMLRSILNEYGLHSFNTAMTDSDCNYVYQCASIEQYLNCYNENEYNVTYKIYSPSSEDIISVLIDYTYIEQDRAEKIFNQLQ